MLLKGKTAVVTGGSRGIGLAIVKRFLEEGANVALCGSREETAQKALDAMIRSLTTDVPYDADVEIVHASYSPGFYAGETPEWLERVWSDAGERLFGQKPGVFFEGGTIGILEHFREAFPDSAFLMTGMLGPNSNAHGPDESLDLAYWEKLTQALSEVLAALPDENERKEVP